MRNMQIDVIWVLVSGMLVFMMQPGFMCLEVGMIRQKNSINVAIKNATDFLVAVILFYALGFALMFGSSYNGWVGADGWFLKKYIDLDQEGWIYSFWFFQAVFCGAAATIVSGGVAERMRFTGYILTSVVISLFIYPIFGHWVWGGVYNLSPEKGWLASLGYKDFAGSSVVHIVGAVTTLACLSVVGPRRGRFNADGSTNKIWGCNLPMSMLGVFLLWLGWFGFNGGSTLRATKDIALIIVNTNIAACAGALSCLSFTWLYKKKLEVEAVFMGILGGLVAITASCAYVSPLSSLVIGILAGPVLIFTNELLDKLRIDDAVGAIPVHGACGVLGILSMALFSREDCLVDGSRAEQLLIQVLGASVCIVYTFSVSWVLFKLIDRYIVKLRVSPEDEEKGLNLSEHKARTVWLEMAQEMHTIEKTSDLKRRVFIEPETEAGTVGTMFNKLMDSLQKNTIALKEKQAQLFQSEKMSAVGQLASGVAHEINNPLGVILGFAQGIKSRMKPEDALSIPINAIEREALRCKELVRDMLAFARTPQEESREEVDFNLAVEGALSLVHVQSKFNNVNLLIELDPHLPLVLASRNQIQQIVINLCTNSIDAMPNGGKIFVKTGRTQENGSDDILLKISDTGDGIPEELQAKIFEPFFTTKETGKGTGLGLSLIYEIVQKHEGKIEVQSEKGQGTSFTIRLPIRKKN